MLGGTGAWPPAGGACSGYLVAQNGFRLLIDPGYATLPVLLGSVAAADVDAVLVSHGHPDHCADLNPLLRARVLTDDPAPALPVYALPHALDAVLALDGRLLAGACEPREFGAGERLAVGPFDVATVALPHSVPNAGLRLSAEGRTLAYTGDTGPSPEIGALAWGADVFLAEASYPDPIESDRDERYLSTAGQAGENAARAGVDRLVLTHLFPGTDPARAVAAAAFPGRTEVARPGLVVDV
ncbi:MAG TPA: MBL fold metallo-hydrolase [Pseudonocardiaceae bacterium]|nr:MBL fold metallo-hydrolase [Pseudonocardiaceae bacterium]